MTSENMTSTITLTTPLWTSVIGPTVDVILRITRTPKTPEFIVPFIVTLILPPSVVIMEAISLGREALTEITASFISARSTLRLTVTWSVVLIARLLLKVTVSVFFITKRTSPG